MTLCSFLSAKISSGGEARSDEGAEGPLATRATSAHLAGWVTNVLAFPPCRTADPEARLNGQLQGLEGEGKPLPDRPGDAFISPGDAVGFRIMAEAGVLPEEIILKKQVIAQRAHLATLMDTAARKAVMAKLADLEMRQAIAEESRRKFLR